MTKSRAEEMAKEYAIKVYGVSEGLDDFEQELTNGMKDRCIEIYLSGMKALLAEAEKIAYAGTDWTDDKVILVVDLSDLKQIMGQDDQA